MKDFCPSLDNNTGLRSLCLLFRLQSPLYLTLQWGKVLSEGAFQFFGY
jgi:hypothetical protein